MVRYLMMLCLGLCLVFSSPYAASGKGLATADVWIATKPQQALEMRRSSGSKSSRRAKSVKIKKAVVKSRSTSLTIVNRNVNQNINNTTNTTIIRPATASAPVAAGTVAASNTARASTSPKPPVCPSYLERYGTIQSGAKTVDVCRSQQGICTLARTSVTIDCSTVKPLSR